MRASQAWKGEREHRGRAFKDELIARLERDVAWLQQELRQQQQANEALSKELARFRGIELCTRCVARMITGSNRA